MAWLANYIYRKSITLSRASGAVTNYQMKLLVGESSGAAGEDVDCNSHCQTDFDDLRFTTSDGTTLLDYWIETKSGATPNQLATVWIEFDSIGTGATTFYMYYGYSSATSVSNGTNTFVFFDDFEDGTINKWSIVDNEFAVATDQKKEGTYSVKAGGTDMSFLYKTINLGTPIRVHFDWRMSHDTTDFLPVYIDQPGSRYPVVCYAGSSGRIQYYNGTFNNFSTNLTFSADTWYELVTLFDTPNHSYTTFLNGTSGGAVTTVLANPASDIVNIALRNPLVASRYGWVDNYFIANYQTTEPAWGSWGSESWQDWANIGKINGVTATDIAKINGVLVADIAKVCGVSV